MELSAAVARSITVWVHTGLMLLMFAAGWLAASRLSLPWRRTLLELAGFNALEGLGLVLTVKYGDWPLWATVALVGVFQVLAYVMLWRAGFRLLGLVNPEREQALVVGPVCLLALVFCSWPQTEAVGRAIVYLGLAFVAWRGGLPAAHRLARTGQRGAGIAAGIITQGMALLLAFWAVSLYAYGMQFDNDYEASTYIGYVSMVASFAMNLLLAYIVFGRQLQELARLAQRDPLTGLMGLEGILQSLSNELPSHARRSRRLAVLLLSIDRLDALGQQWGQETAQAVVAEVALQLRLRLNPGDALAYLGEGRFATLLFDCSPLGLLGTAKLLNAVVQSDAGLHPDGQTRMSLSVGVVMSNPASTAAALVDQAEAARRRAEAAGGAQIAGIEA